nr:hypothetical protein [Neisseria iguanae]
MQAYSAISHMDFILPAFMADAAGLYYAIIYAVMDAAGFGVLMVLSNETIECEAIRDLADMNQRHAWYSF